MVSRRISSVLTVGGALAGALYVVACGGTSTGGNNKVSLKPDSGSGGGTDAAPACTAQTSYSPGAFGSDQAAVNYPASGSGSNAMPHFEEWDGNLTANGSDVLDIELFQGYGGFGTGDIADGTYTISGSDTMYSACGICLTVFTGAMQTGSGSSAVLNVTGAYTASSGSVTLTSVAGTLTGSISNVQFQDVGFMEMNGFPNPNDPASPPVSNCTTSIGSASFSATLQAGSAAVPGDDGQPRHLRLRLTAR